MLPYQNASSGLKARDLLTRILQRFGCEKVGFMDEFAERGISVRHAQMLRQEAGLPTPRQKLRQVNWSRAGLATSNLSDPEISEIYRGARYG